MTSLDVGIEEVWSARAILGEGPVWSDKHEGLFWVDIKRPALHLFRPSHEERLSWPLPQMIGFIAPDATGALTAALEDGLYSVELAKPGATPNLTRVATPETHPPYMRFNDGKRAPDGLVWAGTMDDREKVAVGAWYTLDAANKLTLMADGFIVTNGPAFDVRSNLAYFNDSARRTTYVADISRKGPVSLSVFRQFDEDMGFPDGMTVDANGLLWIAFWDGGCLRALDPDTAETVHTIRLPVPRPTSCTFSSHSDDTLYVTSATVGLSSEQLIEAPWSGSLLAVKGLGALPR